MAETIGRYEVIQKIGAGGMGGYSMDCGLRENLVAIVDVDENTIARTMKEKVKDQAKPKIFYDYRKMLDECHRDLDVVQVMHRLTDDERIDFFLRASVWTGEIKNMEPHKCDDLAWHPIDDLPDNLIPYVRRAIDNYRKGIWFDSFGWS